MFYFPHYTSSILSMKKVILIKGHSINNYNNHWHSSMTASCKWSNNIILILPTYSYLILSNTSTMLRTYSCFSGAWGTGPLFSGHENCLCLYCCHRHLGCCVVKEMPHPQNHWLSEHHGPSLWIGSLLHRTYTVLMSLNCNGTLYHTPIRLLTANSLCHYVIKMLIKLFFN